MMSFKYLVGVDEAGRGPLAGPVAVGVAAVPEGFDWKLLEGVTDSKKLTPENREAIFRRAYTLRREGKVSWSVSMVGAAHIDAKGIVHAINTAMRRGLKSVAGDPTSCRVLLDGALRAPSVYTNQETIIRGDQKEKVIGLASIVAKVTRDRYMERIAALPEFVPYKFEQHKGYGTKMHRTTIMERGLSDVHRKSYCRSCTD